LISTQATIRKADKGKRIKDKSSAELLFDGRLKL